MEDKKSVCLNPKCGKELTRFEGRRKKQFCCSTCKSLVWYSENKEKAKLYRDGKKRNVIKIEEAGQFVKIEEKKTLATTPTKITLQQIRDMCPKELTGLDRSVWINEEKLKHKI